MASLRWHLALVAILFLFELVVGLGIIAPSVGLVVAIVAFWRAIVWKDLRQRLLRIAAVYALLALLSIAAIEANIGMAMRHSQPVIAAVERYHAEQGKYPESLEELVPQYIPAIPRAGFTWVSRRYRYDALRPQLYFAAMFHGVFFFDFPTARWLANE